MSEQRAKDEVPPTVGHRNILVAAVRGEELEVESIEVGEEQPCTAPA